MSSSRAVHSFQFVRSYNTTLEMLGSVGHIGDIVCDAETQCNYYYVNGNWEPLDMYPSYCDATPIRQTKCASCGAPLNLHRVSSNGTVRCEYCESFTYIW